MDGAHGGQSVSALMDGELDAEAAEREIARLKADGHGLDTWHTYHLIGDALRGRTAPASGFTGRFSARLAAEPTVLAPPVRVPRKRQGYALAAAASVAAAAVVGWAAYHLMVPDIPAGQLAAAPSASSPAVQTLVVAAPQQAPSAATFAPAAAAVVEATPAEHVHEYLLAHQGISPTTAIQGVTPYIRTVSNSSE